jgi:hypothetical protein
MYVHNRPYTSTNRLSSKPTYNILKHTITRHRPDTDRTRLHTTRPDQTGPGTTNTPRHVHRCPDTFIHVHTRPYTSPNGLDTIRQHTKTDHHMTPTRLQPVTITHDQGRPKMTGNDRTPPDTRKEVQTRSNTFIIVHTHPLLDSTRSVKTHLQHTRTDHHKTPTRHQPVTIIHDQAGPKITGHD